MNQLPPGPPTPPPFQQPYGAYPPPPQHRKLLLTLGLCGGAAGVFVICIVIFIAAFNAMNASNSTDAKPPASSEPPVSNVPPVSNDPNNPTTKITAKSHTDPTTRIQTTWVTNGCQQYTSWGNCLVPNRVPVQQQVNVPEHWILTGTLANTGQAVTWYPDSYSWDKCKVGDWWPQCRDR